MRVGLVGAGNLGLVHGRRLGDHDDVTELVCYEPSAAASSGLAQMVNRQLAIAESLDDLLSTSPDAVVIASPSRYHSEQINFFLDHKIPIFCEKPLALDLSDALRIQQRVKESHGTLQVGFQRRFSRGYMRAREAIASSRLGDIGTFLMEGHDRQQPSDEYLRTCGGIFKDLHIHDFDIVRFLFESNAVEIFVMTSPAEGGEHMAVKASCVTVRLDNGTVGVLSGLRERGDGPHISAQVLGSRAGIRIGPTEISDSLSVPAPQSAKTVIEQFADAYTDELDHFLQCVLDGTKPRCGVGDGVEALRMASAAEISAREGRRVKLMEIPGAD